MKIYSPTKITYPKRIDVTSAWVGLDTILEDILSRFGVGRERALEFGVEGGFSIVALSQFFKEVIGVDTFRGDYHAGLKDEGFYEEVKRNLKEFKNITLVQSDYKDFKSDLRFDCVHVDILHSYEDTFACGDWAMKHADLVLFHDTASFPEVFKAVSDLAEKYAVEFHNYPLNNGLGILCNLPS